MTNCAPPTSMILPQPLFTLLLLVVVILTTKTTTTNAFVQSNNNSPHAHAHAHAHAISISSSRYISSSVLFSSSSPPNSSSTTGNEKIKNRKISTYDLGVGKNLPVGYNDDNYESNFSGSIDIDNNDIHWNVPEYPNKKKIPGYSNQKKKNDVESLKRSISSKYTASSNEPRRVRRMVARTEESNSLRGAIWDEEHYSLDNGMERKEISSSSPFEAKAKGGIPTTPSLVSSSSLTVTNSTSSLDSEREGPIAKPEQFYPNIDLSIPSSVYDPETSKDIVWDLMRWEAYQEAQREPLLVSFLYSSILNHDSLESSLAFLLANKLSSAAMISTQIQSLILNALHKDRSIGRSIRADIMAVRDRDPACLCLPDVFLYFKGFHALQTYRVAHAIWKTDNKQVLAHYLQSQMSQTFQIDIHPNATLGSGIMLDHGTGIVIGETAHLGHNCSILHHVTLGGSGKKGVDRHPKVRFIIIEI